MNLLHHQSHHLPGELLDIMYANRFPPFLMIFCITYDQFVTGDEMSLVFRDKNTVNVVQFPYHLRNVNWNDLNRFNDPINAFWINNVIFTTLVLH